MRTFLQRSLIALTSGAPFLTSCSGSDSSAPPACVVSAVSVSPSPGAIEVGASVTLTATITQQNCSGLTVSWSSSNAAVASVSATGEVVGAAAGGPVTISASAGGQTGSVSVMVVPAAVATVTLASAYSNLTVGVQNTVTATLRDARGAVLTGRTLTWSTSNASVVSVTPAGVVQGVALGGPVNITATSEGRNASVPITVVPRYAYAFANQATPTAPYDAPALSSYSTVGAATTITRTSAGTYSVRLRNMAAGAQQTAVLASAFGVGNATCKVQIWVDDGADLLVPFHAGHADDSGLGHQRVAV